MELGACGEVPRVFGQALSPKGALDVLRGPVLASAAYPKVKGVKAGRPEPETRYRSFPKKCYNKFRH